MHVQKREKERDREGTECEAWGDRVKKRESERELKKEREKERKKERE